MAVINDIVNPHRVIESETEFRNTFKEWPNGRQTVRREWSTPVREWLLEYDALTSTEYNALVAHFNAMFGRYGTFQFRDPHNATLYNVRFADDKLKRRNTIANVRGRYSVSFRVREVK